MKRRLLFAFLALATLGCTGTDPVAGFDCGPKLILQPDSFPMKVGSSTQITAAQIPTASSCQIPIDMQFDWSVDSNAIIGLTPVSGAAVSVSGKAAGRALVTATSRSVRSGFVSKDTASALIIVSN